MFKKILDNTDPNSLANKFRRKRFRYFKDFIKDLQLPISILDVGGTADFWRQMGLLDKTGFEITVLNINEPEVPALFNIKFIKGDAADLSEFGDKSFDVVFSNSVIEHIPLTENRFKMADEIRRVSKRYFVQTPNYYFPFDPHFLFPCFQFFPVRFQVFLLTRFNMGWFKKCGSNETAISLLENNSLLKQSEITSYFPDAIVFKEKFLLLSKSFIVKGS